MAGTGEAMYLDWIGESPTSFGASPPPSLQRFLAPGLQSGAGGAFDRSQVQKPNAKEMGASIALVLVGPGAPRARPRRAGGEGAELVWKEHVEARGGV